MTIRDAYTLALNAALTVACVIAFAALQVQSYAESVGGVVVTEAASQIDSAETQVEAESSR